MGIYTSPEQNLLLLHDMVIVFHGVLPKVAWSADAIIFCQTQLSCVAPLDSRASPPLLRPWPVLLLSGPSRNKPRDWGDMEFYPQMPTSPCLFDPPCQGLGMTVPHSLVADSFKAHPWSWSRLGARLSLDAVPLGSAPRDLPSPRFRGHDVPGDDNVRFC